MRKEDLLRKRVGQVDMEEIDSIESLVASFGSSSFQSRALNSVAVTWERMLTEGEATVFLGLSGAMIAGGMRKIIADLVSRNLVDVVVTTGAIVYQDLYQARGYGHFLADLEAPDSQLREMYIDRIYDTYVDEEAFRRLDLAIGERFQSREKPITTREFFALLADMAREPGSILGACAENDVPIYCPAIADSSIGIGLAVVRQKTGEGPLIDTVQDNIEMARLVGESKSTGAVYIGGGVPKNYINDAVVTADMLYGDIPGHEYAVQITMDRPEWGGLSGSTLGEAQSWGKVSADAKKSMAFVDLTIGLPLVAGYLFSKDITREPKRLYKWFE